MIKKPRNKFKKVQKASKRKGQAPPRPRAKRPPKANNPGGHKPPKPGTVPASGGADPVEPPLVEANPANIALAGLVVIAVLGLLLFPLLWVGRRSRPNLGTSFALLAVCCFGLALGAAQLALVDVGIRLLGHTSYAWTALLPVALAGVALGRLSTDAVSTARLHWVIGACSIGGAVLLAVVFPLVVGPLTDLYAWSWGLRVALLVVILGISGWLLGAPLAGVLRSLSDEAPTTMAMGWGVHAFGWALGSVLGLIVAQQLGVSAGLVLSVACSVVGTLALVLWRLRKPAPAV